MSNRVQQAVGVDRKSMVDYLVRRRHAPEGWNIRQARKDPSHRWDVEAFAAATKFRKELEAMTLPELKSAYDAELKVETEEKRKKADAEEAGRAWNQPHARTDYEFWSKAASWTLDEATALTLGRDPHVVTWKSIGGSTWISAFAQKYERQRDLILRAKGMGLLFDPALPSFFLAWAQRTGIELDEKLVEAVEAQGIQVADWQTLYDEMLKIAQGNKQIGEAALKRCPIRKVPDLVVVLFLNIVLL